MICSSSTKRWKTKQILLLNDMRATDVIPLKLLRFYPLICYGSLAVSPVSRKTERRPFRLAVPLEKMFLFTFYSNRVMGKVRQSGKLLIETLKSA